MTHRPRKRFGQHFLTAQDVIAQIIAAIAPRPGQTIVEIGPGQGAITEPLAASGAALHAIEFDRDLIPGLVSRYTANKQVTIHEADALEFDFSSLGDELRIVGNLPYNISTPLLFHLLNYKNHIADAHFMLQKEVVDRMTAAACTKNYGRLTVMLGCQLEMVPLFDVPQNAFSPPPKVLSSVIRLRPIPSPGYDVKNVSLLEKIVKTAFSKRRKTLRNALDGVAGGADMEAVSINANDRPEQVEVADWVRLANYIEDNPRVETS